MPKRIVAISLLFIAFGLLAIWSVIVDLTHSKLSLNFAVFLLPVGIGLLRGKKSSQWWARFWVILGYCLVGGMIAIAFAAPQELHVNWFGNRIHGPSAVPYAIMCIAVPASVLVLVHLMLYSKKSNAFFDRNGQT